MLNTSKALLLCEVWEALANFKYHLSCQICRLQLRSTRRLLLHQSSMHRCQSLLEYSGMKFVAFHQRRQSLRSHCAGRLSQFWKVVAHSVKNWFAQAAAWSTRLISWSICESGTASAFGLTPLGHLHISTLQTRWVAGWLLNNLKFWLVPNDTRDRGKSGWGNVRPGPFREKGHKPAA